MERRFKLFELLSVGFVLVLSVWLLFGRSMTAGFKVLHGDLGDARFIHYLLEHTYQAFPSWDRIWNAQFYFPHKNALAFSDTLLTGAFPYWVFRIFGVEIYSAYELWLVSLCILNFSAMYLLLLVGCRNTILGATMGAYLFSFSSPRVVQLVHPQLLIHFWTPLCILSIVLWMRREKRNLLYMLLAAIFLAAQFYASFYLGVFLLMGLVLGTGLMLLRAPTRELFVERIRISSKEICIAASAGIVILLPLALKYLEASQHATPRGYGEILSALPTGLDWIRLGDHSFLYSWIGSKISVVFEQERRLGLGLITSGIIIWAAWRLRARMWVYGSAVTIITFIVLVTNFSGFSLWRLMYEIVPGSSVIRAPSRIILFALVPTSILIAHIFDHFSRSKGVLLSLILAALIMIEQRQYPPVFPVQPVNATVEELQSLLQDKACSSFFYTIHNGRFFSEKYQIDAMWASLLSGIPTVNGYSGLSPRQWRLNAINIGTADDEAHIMQNLDSWTDQHGLKPCRLIGDGAKQFTLEQPQG